MRLRPIYPTAPPPLVDGDISLTHHIHSALLPPRPQWRLCSPSTTRPWPRGRRCHHPNRPWRRHLWPPRRPTCSHRSRHQMRFVLLLLKGPLQPLQEHALRFECQNIPPPRRHPPGEDEPPRELHPPVSSLFGHAAPFFFKIHPGLILKCGV